MRIQLASVYGDGTVLPLEPDDHPAVARSKQRSSRTGSHSRRSPSTTSTRRSRNSAGSGVRFTQEPLQTGPPTTAVFDDTCGNLIQIASRA